MDNGEEVTAREEVEVESERERRKKKRENDVRGRRFPASKMGTDKSFTKSGFGKTTVSG